MLSLSSEDGEQPIGIVRHDMSSPSTPHDELGFHTLESDVYGLSATPFLLPLSSPHSRKLPREEASHMQSHTLPHATGSSLKGTPFRTSVKVPSKRSKDCQRSLNAIRSLLPEFVDYFDTFEEPIVKWLERELKIRGMFYMSMHPDAAIELMANTLITHALPLMYKQHQEQIFDKASRSQNTGSKLPFPSIIEELDVVGLPSKKALVKEKERELKHECEKEQDDDLIAPLLFLENLLLTQLARIHPDDYLEPTRAYHADLLMASNRLAQLLALVDGAQCELLSGVTAFLVYRRRNPKVSRILIIDTLLKPVCTLLRQFYEMNYGFEIANAMVKHGMNPIPFDAIIEQWMRLYIAKTDDIVMTPFKPTLSFESSSSRKEMDIEFDAADLVSAQGLYDALHRLLLHSFEQLSESSPVRTTKRALSQSRAKVIDSRISMAESVQGDESEEVHASVLGTSTLFPHEMDALLGDSIHPVDNPLRRSRSCPSLKYGASSFPRHQASHLDEREKDCVALTAESILLFIQQQQRSYCALVYAWLIKSLHDDHGDLLGDMLTVSPMREKVLESLMDSITNESLSPYQEDDLLQILDILLSFELDMFRWDEISKSGAFDREEEDKPIASFVSQVAANRVLNTFAPRSTALALSLMPSKSGSKEEVEILSLPKVSFSSHSSLNLKLFKTPLFYTLCRAYFNYETPEKTAYYVFKQIVYEEEGELKMLLECYFTFLRLFPIFHLSELPFAFFAIEGLFRTWIGVIIQKPMFNFWIDAEALFIQNTLAHFKSSVEAVLKGVILKHFSVIKLNRASSTQFHGMTYHYGQYNPSTIVTQCLVGWQKALAFPTSPKDPLIHCLELSRAFYADTI